MIVRVLVGQRDRGCLLQPQQAGDQVKVNPAAVESVGDFRHATADAMSQPLARGRSLVVHRRGRLQVQHHHGPAAVLSNLDMRGAHGVSRGMAEDQIDIRRVQLLGRLPSSSLAIDHADVADFAPRRHPLGDELVVAKQSIKQTLELFPVVCMPDRVKPDAGSSGRLRGVSFRSLWAFLSSVRQIIAVADHQGRENQRENAAPNKCPGFDTRAAPFVERDPPQVTEHNDERHVDRPA